MSVSEKTRSREREARFWEEVQAIRGDMRGFAHLQHAIPPYDGQPRSLLGKLIRSLQTPNPIGIKVAESSEGDLVRLVSGLALPSDSPTARWGKHQANVKSMAETPVDIPDADREALSIMSRHMNLTAVSTTANPSRIMEGDYPDSYLTYPFLRDGEGKLTGLKTGGRYYYNGRLVARYEEPGPFLQIPARVAKTEYLPWEWAIGDGTGPYYLDPELPIRRHDELVAQGLELEIAELWAAAQDHKLNPDHAVDVRKYLASLRKSADPTEEPWLRLVA